MASWRPGAGAALLLALGAAPASPALLINEILPDPPGSDAGHEFVEFLNTGAEIYDLEGVEFQFANGAEGPVWRTRWRGGAGQAVPPQGRFLLVDRLWADQPAGDAAATLDLQNGPDAVRLVRDGEVLDLVGYGALTDPELFAGAPAALEPGLALARRPDGADTGRNADDFVAAAPTPGTANFRAWSVAAGAAAMEPPSLLRPGEAVSVRLAVVNDGLEDWGPAELRLAGGGGQAAVRLDALPAGAERSLAWTLRPARPGTWPLAVAVRPPGAPDTLRLAAGRLQVGPAALVLGEVLAAPAAGQGEWVEVLAAGPAAVDLDGWIVEDEDGGRCVLPPLALAAGERAVAAQDSAALAAWLAAVAERGGTPDCPPATAAARLRQAAGWPTLNNSPPADRAFADRVLLRAPDGTVVDHVVVGAPGGPDVAGRSLERTTAAPTHPSGPPWAVCTAGPGSTPGCANSTALAAAAGTELVLVPPVLDPDRAVHAVFALEAGRTGWRLRVYDLWGTVVRDFGGDDLGPGPRDLLWDGCDDGGRRLPPGGYVFVLETWAAGADRPARTRRLCAVR